MRRILNFLIRTCRADSFALAKWKKVILEDISCALVIVHQGKLSANELRQRLQFAIGVTKGISKMKFVLTTFDGDLQLVQQLSKDFRLDILTVKNAVNTSKCLEIPLKSSRLPYILQRHFASMCHIATDTSTVHIIAKANTSPNAQLFHCPGPSLRGSTLTMTYIGVRPIIYPPSPVNGFRVSGVADDFIRAAGGALGFRIRYVRFLTEGLVRS